MSRVAGPRAPSSPPRPSPNVLETAPFDPSWSPEARRRQRVSTVTPTERTDEPTAIRVAVADDEETVVDVLRTLIGSDPTLRFVGSANDAEAAIDVAMRERPDVILVDVRMPGGGGVRAVREITRRCPPTKIVALSAHEDPHTVIRM